MQLEKLLKDVGVLETNVDKNFEIHDIKAHSNDVEENDMFVCMQGVKDDANNYISQIDKIFVALTSVKPQDASVKYVLVEDVRGAYALVCRNFFEDPKKDMKFVSIVGTNGKTSTAHYINSILTFAGFKTGLIGTEGHYILGERVAQSLTTPDPYELYELLSKMRAKGVEVVIAEVSAHAIYLEKLAGIVADVALLTNISQDHLDFFKDYENYVGVKMSYFDKKYIKCALVNVDDKSGKILFDRLEKSDLEHYSFGLYNPADCFAIDVREGIDGVNFVCNLQDEIVEVKSKLYGEFNVYNLLGALSVCSLLGVDCETLQYAVRKIKSVKGRFSVLHNEKGTIIIDFAHTPDGLSKLLSTARTLTKSRLITVFGCGGDRDKTKRASMGEMASKYSDSIVLTSDNPRSENPQSIIEQIEFGVSLKDVKCIVDRTEAVRYALSQMEEGDTLVIAGKGNESYLEIKGKRIAYNDFDVVARYGGVKGW